MRGQVPGTTRGGARIKKCYYNTQALAYVKRAEVSVPSPGA